MEERNNTQPKNEGGRERESERERKENEREGKSGKERVGKGAWVGEVEEGVWVRDTGSGEGQGLEQGGERTVVRERQEREGEEARRKAEREGNEARREGRREGAGLEEGTREICWTFCPSRSPLELKYFTSPDE